MNYFHALRRLRPASPWDWEPSGHRPPPCHPPPPPRARTDCPCSGRSALSEAGSGHAEARHWPSWRQPQGPGSLPWGPGAHARGSQWRRTASSPGWLWPSWRRGKGPGVCPASAWPRPCAACSPPRRRRVWRIVLVSRVK